MTKNIPEGDQLFTGLTKIEYEDIDKKSDHASLTKEEVDAALATSPNGAIFGSPYYRVPFSVGVSLWNHYANRKGKFAKWMTKTFGKQPVLMSWVNPELRASVARSVLRNHGYFHGQVDFSTVTQKNAKTAKIGYKVQMDSLFRLDSISYIGYSGHSDSLIHATLADAHIHKGDGFSTASLDAERSRISTLLRNNGYYFYQPGYASYLADTFQVDNKVQLRFQLADGLDSRVLRQRA